MGLNLRQWLMIAAAALVILVGGFFVVQNLQNGVTIQASGTTTGTQAASTQLSADLAVVGPLGERALGDPKAPNVIVEYASMTCPHCQAWNHEVFPQLKAKYIDTGKVYFIFRDFPLDPVALSAVMIAHCVPDRFFPLVDLMFAQQATWARAQDPTTALQDLVRQAGIGQDQFRACLTNQSLLDGVNWSRERASKVLSVGSTPTFFVNGAKLEGNQPLEALEKRLVGLTS